MGSDLLSLLSAAIRMGASDLYLAAGQRAFFRKDGELAPDAGKPLDAAFLGHCMEILLDEGQRGMLEERLELDFSWEGCGRRFRGNAYRQRGMPALALRLIPERIPSLAELGAPKALEELLGTRQGLLLVTGRTGSGKTTTLAAFLAELAARRPVHALTLEDPIEFLHANPHCLISQRELGRDFRSFPQALKSALRESPDVILVGEIRDADTMRLALEAAETGAFVLGTLHTRSAAETAMRVEGMFPAAQRDAIRDQFAGVFAGIFSQQLLPAREGGRVSATEVLLATPSTRSLVRQGKHAQLPTAMMAGRDLGMRTMDMALKELAGRQKISRDTSFRAAIAL